MIRCDCGHVLEEREVAIAGFTTLAMVCPHCGFVTLTLEQAKRLQRLQKLQELLGAEREITKIGDSLGILLPREITEFGVEEGQKVKVDLANGRRVAIEIETALALA